jgi:CheY-like chemotaxis protein
LAVIHGGSSINLIITDYQMPGMNGLVLATVLKQSVPSIPVIMCSAFADRNLLLEARTVGVVAFIEKPFSLDLLRQVLDNVLGCPAKQARCSQPVKEK